MNSFYDYQTTCGRFSLLLSNSLSFAEREIHAYHEILYCADADTVLHTENRQLSLKGRNLLIIPKGQYHLFDLSATSHFPRLKISVPAEAASEIPECSLFSDIHVYSTLSLHADLLLRQISEALHHIHSAKQAFYLASAVTMLLAELNALPPIKPACYLENSSLLVQVTDHISRNLSNDLSIRNLSKIFSVSPSFLTHRFQKEVGIPLHRYITQKRMIHAWEQIASGREPTKIYPDCGYSDYSSFYKAYCKFFSVPPSIQTK